MIFTIIIYSRDHGSNSYVEFQLGLQNSINTSILIVQSSVQGKCTNLGLLRCDTTYYMDGYTKATAFATPANILCLPGMELDPLTPMPM